MSKTSSVSVPTERHLVKNLLALVSALVVTAVLCFAPSSALAATAHEYKSSFGPDCTEATQFKEPGAVAVDEATHDVYVADQAKAVEEVFRCTANGEEADFTAGPGVGTNHIPGFAFTAAQGSSQIAVSPITHDFYVADRENLAVKAFAPDGEEVEFTAGEAAGTNQLFGFFPAGVAVDANGDIYVASALGGANFTGAVAVFAPDGEELTSFETSVPTNLAVDSHGAIYVDHEITKTVEKFTPSTFPVTSATTYPAEGIFAEGGTNYSLAIDPVSGDLYFDQRPEAKHSELVQRDAGGNFLDTFAAPGELGELANSEGIAIDGSTGVVYAADTEFVQSALKHQVRVYAPAAAKPPSIGGSSVVSVAAVSATVEAQVDSEHFDTHYRFQYLTEAEYEANGETFAGALSTPEADLGSAAGLRSARAQLSGLVPDTSYVFRVAAENSNDQGSPEVGVVSPGKEGEFHTYPMHAAGLPDGRNYELVSPAAKSGEVFVPAPEARLAGSCEREGQASSECYPGFFSQMTPMQSTPNGEAVAYAGYPFAEGFSSAANEYVAKRGSQGWSTESLSTPLYANGINHAGYEAFSPDLTESVSFQIAPALSSQTPTRDGKVYADLYLRGPDGVPRPLVTVAPPNRIAGFPLETTGEEFQLVFGGGNSGSASSSAFSHLVFAANDALTGATAVAPAAVDGGVHSEIPTRPSNLDLYEWVGGQLRLVNVKPGNATTAPGAVLGSGLEFEPFARETPDVDHAISNDGSHIFWSEEGSGQVYVRIDGDETQQMADPGKFLVAASDGSKVLLNDGCLYALVSDSCEADLSQGHGAEGFEGILGAAENLSRIYFVDRAALTPSSDDNANNEHATAGNYNLYEWDAGSTKFIAALIEEDGEPSFHFPYGDWKASSSDRLAQVTPDGSQLAFMSLAPLTGYDSTVRARSECRLGDIRCSEVFEYDANSGKLSCASCDPTGQRPLGTSTLSLIEGEHGGGFPPLPQPKNLSPDGDGRLFFESQDQLSPADINGNTADVYEWEPGGVGSCIRAEGCIFLISSGRSDSDSSFIDSSDSGDDAFFVTRSQLVRQDTDEQLDLYDARVGGGIAENENAPCDGEGCKETVPASGPSSSGSAAFTGPGNLAAPVAGPAVKPKTKAKPLTRAQKLAQALGVCAKKPRAKRQACRAQARKRYGPVVKKKSSGSKSNVKGRK